MKKIIIISFVLLIFLLFGSAVMAEEIIDDFSVEIKINRDASINVSETITYNFGDLERHGIFRDIPYKYKARGGSYKLKISDISVSDENGSPRPFSVSTEGSNKRVKIGDAGSYVSGSKVYVINYTVRKAINYFDDYDELYWNVTGNDWPVGISQSKAVVRLPASLAADKLQAACYAGRLGSNGHCVSYRYSFDSGNRVDSIIFTDDRLSAGEGLTAVVGIPKGIISQPSRWQGIVEIIRDNVILFLPFLVLAIMFYLWQAKGRDPAGQGTIIAQFDAPDGLTPAEVGTLVDERADNYDISADIIHLAAQGYLRIERIESKKGHKKADYELVLLNDGSGLKSEHERELLEALFVDKKRIKISELKNKFYKDLAKIKKEIYNKLVAAKYFPHNPQSVRGLYIAVGVVFAFLSWLMGPIFGFWGVISVIISSLIIIIFGFFMGVRTKAGVLAKEHILGFKEYLRVAEKDRLEFHNAPEKSPKVFEKLLPYAMALGVEKEWAKQFEGIYFGQPDWYRDVSGSSFSALALSDSLGDFGRATNTAMASRPSSSASSGGSGFSGGSSGGGFGGGGGGSW